MNEIFNNKIDYGKLDFDAIDSAFKRFLQSPNSPFKDYNLDGAGSKNLRMLMTYFIHYLTFYLNMGINESNITTAEIPDNIYKLITKYGYIPSGKRPASKLFEFFLYRASTKLTRLTVDSLTGFSINDKVTNTVGGLELAMGNIQAIDDDGTNLYLYVDTTTDTITFANGTVSNGTVSTNVTDVTENNDFYVTDDNKKFYMKFTSAEYADGYNVMPTYRDKWMENKYTESSLNIVNQNRVVFEMQPIIIDDNRYIKVKTNAIQANWNTLELSSPVEITNADDSQEIYFTIDGQPDKDSIYKNKIINDTIRVFILEDGTDWTNAIEYTNVDMLDINSNIRHFKIKYDIENGIYLKFNINGFCRRLSNTDKIRIIYAYTQGDDINTMSGVNVYGYDQNNISSIGFVQITDEDSNVLYGIDNGVLIDGLNYLLYKGVEKNTFTANIVDGNGVLTDLDNGLDVPDIEDIKEIATLSWQAKNNAVIDNDYTTFLKNRYTEYKDIITWSGGKEYLDINNIIINIFGGGTSNTYNIVQFIEAMNNAHSMISHNGILVTKPITFTDVENGLYRNDKGHVYYSIANNDFTFETNPTNISLLENYLNDYKLNSLAFRNMQPNYLLLKLNISYRLNSSYVNNYSISQRKENIMKYINENSFQFKGEFNLDKLKEYIKSFDEVADLYNFDITYNIKFKNNNTEYNYFRLFNALETDLNGSLSNKNMIDNDGNQYYISSNSSILTIGNDSSTATDNDWSFDKANGAFRFKYDFGTAEYVYIKNLPMKINNGRLKTQRELIIGVENINDISIVVV